jgi:signal peptidase I
MKTFRKIAINLFIYLAIVAATVWGLPRLLSRVLDTPYPMAAITSGSMWPALKEGDLVFIEGVQKDELMIGDVIVFRNPENDTFTIHRIKELREDDLITKGDANFDPDTPISYDDVIGRNVKVFGRSAHIPLIGAVTVWANRK